MASRVSRRYGVYATNLVDLLCFFVADASTSSVTNVTQRDSVSLYVKIWIARGRILKIFKRIDSYIDAIYMEIANIQLGISMISRRILQ